jgi:N-acyl-L-homoserine lactone synthetase
MFLALDQASLARHAPLHRSMLLDRAQQFVVRHRWPLHLDAAGLEVDEYDDGAATYCVVAEGGRHLASARLRQAAQGCMVERSFPALWQPQLAAEMEITRFCASPSLSPDERLTAVSELLLGLCRHCQREGIQSFFGIVFPAMARALRQAGWPAEILGRTQAADGTLLLARWMPSEMVAWDIQERREFREEAWDRRRERAQERVAA